VKLLLDTRLLLWVAGQPDRLSQVARQFIEDKENELTFSTASLWEVVIKRGLGRDDFKVDPRLLRRGLLDHFPQQTESRWRVRMNNTSATSGSSY
jgi:hypothetical protein